MSERLKGHYAQVAKPSIVGSRKEGFAHYSVATGTNDVRFSSFRAPEPDGRGVTAPTGGFRSAFPRRRG